MKLVESILTKNPCYTAGRKIRVKGLMLHSVGCPQPSASVFVKNWNSASYSSACVHGFIDGNDGTVYQTLPWNHRGWHCGSGSKDSGNNTHIGVEMCEPACIKYTGGANFTCSDTATAKAVAQRTYQAAVELFAMLCEKYSLDPLADGVVISHKEGCARGIASNHGDPEHLWTQLGLPYTMDTFRKAVKAAMGGGTAAPSGVSGTKIMGAAVATAEQMQTYLKAKNPAVAQSVLDMVPLYLSEGAAEGVRGDIAFAQSCLETGNFTFSGSAVTLDQNNFCGMGVTANGLKGNSFSTPQLGIRAQVQHLKAYASTEPLKGELLLTIMSSLAQEESRSISENVTWGQRKRFADGKVSLPYKQFLGYEKGPDDIPVVVEEEAKIVRRIFSLFMAGKTPYLIAKALTADGIPTPAGKSKWGTTTVASILTNEKYKGAALLQKKFTIDFLDKKMKINEGEVPQYYIEQSHQPIIDPEEFDKAQAEFVRRKGLGHRYSGNSIFAARIVCGDCGSFYGSKVWHSNSKYRRTIWQCNEKFAGERKCRTPHLREEDIKARFLAAFNQLLNGKDALLEDCRVMQDHLTNCSALDAELDELLREIEVVTELTQRCIQENARSTQSQEEYTERYNGYVARYDAAKAKLDTLQKEKAQRLAQADSISGFMFELSEYTEAVTEFDEGLWLAVIEKATAYHDGRLVFTFQNGIETEG